MRSQGDHEAGQGRLRVVSDHPLGKDTSPRNWLSGIVITKPGAAKHKEVGVDDPARRVKDRIIRVKGTVIIKEKRPRIEVDDPEQIRIVGKDRKR